jgi:hypothetical protein
MKAKIYFAIILLFAGISVVQAQIKGKVLSGTKEIKTIKENGYDKIIGNYSFFIEEVGSPELPVVLKSYLIPMDADNIIIDINSVSKQKIAGEYTVFPAQPPQTTNNKYTLFVQPDQKIYDSEIQFPNKVPEIITDEFYLGYRIVTIRLYPFEYIPKRKELYACDIDFSINYTLTKSSQKKNIVTQYQTLYRQELNKKAIKFRVENPEDVDKYNTKVENIVDGKNVILNNTTIANNNSGLRSAHSISVLDERIPEYIIITADSLTNAFRPLADWKIKKGIYTIIQSVENITANYQGSDLAEQIRNYIIDAKSKYGNGLFILLGGGINIIPPRMVYGIHDPEDKAHETRLYPTDMYYSTYINSWNANNNDKFNEYQHNYNSITGVYQGATDIDLADYSLGVILGRIPVENTAHVSIWVNKVISYEKAINISNPNYFKNNLYSDAYMNYNNSTGKLGSFAMSSIKSYITNFVPNGINNKYICDNADCSGSSSTSKYGTYCPNGDIELNHANFLSCLNTGADLGLGKFHFIYHMDHCGPTNMGVSSKDKGQSINRADIDNLTNGTSYQIMMSSGCHPANFEYDCIGTHYLINSNGGGVAFLGNTDSGWTSEYNQLQYFLDALYSKTGHLLGRYDIGSIYQYSLSGSSTTKWRLHLLGDPEMQVWTNVPQTFNVTTSPTSIQTGVRTLTVTVSGLSIPSGETALICVSKGTEVYETKTINGNGAYTIPIDAQTTGTMSVTVTAHNYKPVEKTVSVTTNTASNLFINSVNFVDNGTSSSVGNGNGQNDAGETIRLQVAVKNNGATTATGLTATLSCNSDSITVLSSTASLSNIASGSSVTGNFLYQIHKDMHETLSNSPNPVTFQLQITSSSGLSWTKTFNIDVFAVDLKQRNKIITNSASSPFDLEIELQNTGKAPSSGLSGYLYFYNDSIVATFPAINSLETKLSDTFQIPLSLVLTPDFTLKVKNTFGKTWTFSFTLTKPAAVTNLGFLSGETLIDLTWNPVSSAGGYNIYRCNVGANDAKSGSYVKLNNEPVSFSFFSDANGLGSLTKYYYKVAAVSSSGMEGNAVELLAWTSYPQKYLFPVTMNTTIGDMRSAVNVADVNFDGKKEIFAVSKSGWIVGLDYEGNELFDIDNNVTTYSGFANMGVKGWGGVALADVKKTGEYNVIVPTRDLTTLSANRLFSFSVKDSNGDGQPDLLWNSAANTEYERGAIVSNLDNSADGSMETVILPIRQSGSPILIYDVNGALIRSISIPVADYYAYGALAVADLDNDGDKEIILGCDVGIYVWHHDGTNFIPNKQPIYSTTDGYKFRSSVVVCDINGDGNKDILTCAITAVFPYKGKIYAVTKAGALINGWGTSAQSIPHDSDYYRLDISVGDLDNNGKLEVVAYGKDSLKIWKNTGEVKTAIATPDPTSARCVPILADIDGDSDIEIVIASNVSKNIHAYKHDGRKVVGFPLLSVDVAASNLCIDDVDNDGFNELIAIGANRIQMWKTGGSPSRIEWGRDRHDQFNTGEYYKICDPVLVLSNTTWNSTRSICGDIIVKSGTLTISNNSNVSMDASSMILVMNGATLHIDSGHLLNSNVKILDGGNLIISNNGSIKPRNNGKFNVMQGASFTFQLGVCGGI